MDKLLSDLGYLLRQLGKTPVFTLTVILTLGSANGVKAAMSCCENSPSRCRGLWFPTLDLW